MLSPVCQSNSGDNISKSITQAEKRKDNMYKERVEKYMGAKFIPLILSSGGGMSRKTNDFIKHISLKIAGSIREDEKTER